MGTSDKPARLAVYPKVIAHVGLAKRERAHHYEEKISNIALIELMTCLLGNLNGTSNY